MLTGTIEEALQRASFFFQKADLESPRTEAELLLTWAAGWERVQIYMHRSSPLPPETAGRFWASVERRRRGEPLAYITGLKEFYGLEFKVDKRVLVPRPETEFVVEAVLEWSKNCGLDQGESIRAVDLGTGSGVLAVTLACRLPKARVWGVDLSAAALQVARENAARHNVSQRIVWHRGDFFRALDGLQPQPRFNLVVSNPPYIRRPELTVLPATVKDFEPRLALDGGTDGLESYRSILRDLPRFLERPGFMALEIGTGQDREVECLCRELALFHSLTFRRDYQGWPRVMEGFV